MKANGPGSTPNKTTASEEEDVANVVGEEDNGKTLEHFFNEDEVKARSRKQTTPSHSTTSKTHKSTLQTSRSFFASAIMVCLNTFFIHHSANLISRKSIIYDDATSIMSKGSKATFSGEEKARGKETKKSTRFTNRAPIQEDMPQWIVDYVRWHNEKREAFPGSKLITDPNSPGVLVRWCGNICGGLHDRLGQLPLDLYVANMTRRVLLIKWDSPYDLSHFLQPPSSASGLLSLDWTFPADVPDWTYNTTDTNRNIQSLERYPIINNIGEARFTTTLPQAVDQALSTHGLKDQRRQQNDDKLVIWHVAGHLNEDYLESQLHELGETDLIHSTSSFGYIWHMFFEPVPHLQSRLEGIMKELNLVSKQYTAVHCRVRHPKAFKRSSKWVKSIKGGRSPPDESGLPFDQAGPMRDFAVKTAVHALKCAATRLHPEGNLTRSSISKERLHEPYYFMSDSNDLVEYVVRDIRNETYRKQHPSMDQEVSKSKYHLYSDAHHLVTKTLHNIVSRNNSMFNAHIDLQRNEPIEAYYGVFLDLYLAMEARCVSYGLGFFGLFASKLGGTTNCTVQYAKDQWSVQTTQHKTNDASKLCRPKDYQGML